MSAASRCMPKSSAPAGRRFSSCTTGEARARTWRPVIEHLAATNRCVAYDPRGWGRSGAPLAGFGIRDLSATAPAFGTPSADSLSCSPPPHRRGDPGSQASSTPARHQRIGSSLVARLTRSRCSAHAEPRPAQRLCEGERRDSNPRPPGPQPGAQPEGRQGKAPVIAAIRGRTCLAARRLPGVYAGAQPRLSPRKRRVRDIYDFQDFRVFEPPGFAAVRSPVHDS